MRRWRLSLAVALLAVAAAVVAAVSGIATNVAATAGAKWFPTMDDHPISWLAGATVAVAVIAVMIWSVQRRYERSLTELIPAAAAPESWMVDRPAEVASIVGALRSRCRSATVGITTAVHGPGGFGKTTIARLVVADRRVLRHFRGRIFWITLGRDVRGGALITEISDLIRRLSPEHSQPFTDVRQAADHLAAVLAAGPRRLIVVDDVWFEDQLDAFPVAGRCSRLVTTRITSLLARKSVRVRVDEMSPGQARRVLTAGLPGPLPPTVVADLLAETGRWPLLLGLLNKILIDQSGSRTDVGAAGLSLLAQLRREGTVPVDRLTRVGKLDVSDPHQRRHAVSATIEASTGLLVDEADRDRFMELAVFVEDEVVPVALVLALWQATGRMNEMDARALCARLHNLALLSLSATVDGGTIMLHDVIRDHLRDRLGKDRMLTLHETLLTVAAQGLTADPEMAWWKLPDSSGYLRDHLVEHLQLAGRAAEAEALATDLRWVLARLEDAGTSAVLAELSRMDSPCGKRLQRAFAREAHLLAPTEPTRSRAAVLRSRFSHDPDWGAQARALPLPGPALTSGWPLPDPPSPALQRTIAAHAGKVTAIALAADGTWFVSGGQDGVVRIWETGTGRLRCTMSGHQGAVFAVAIAADQDSVVTLGRDRVRIWDVLTGQQRCEMRSHGSGSALLALAPDGTWWAVARRHAVVVRNVAVAGRGGPRNYRLCLRKRPVLVMGASLDSASLLTVDRYGSVHVRDLTTGHRRVFDRPRPIRYPSTIGYPRSLALAGHTLALAATRSTVVWDLRRGGEPQVLPGHRVVSLGLSPDGSLMVTGGFGGSINLWDIESSRMPSVMNGHRDLVTALVMPTGGSWLLSAGEDGTIRTWDLVESGPTVENAAIAQVVNLAIAPDGRRVITGNYTGVLRIRSIAADGAGTAEPLFGNWPDRPIGLGIISPDGRWIIAADRARALQVPIYDSSRLVRSFGEAAGVEITALAMPTGGAFLAMGNAMGNIHVADFVSGWPMAWLNPSTPDQNKPWRGTRWVGVEALAAAPDGSWLASMHSRGIVAVMDVCTARIRAVLDDRRHRISAIAIAPNGAWLIAADTSGLLHFWSARTGRWRTVATGEPGQVAAIAVAPHGKLIATGNRDGTIRIRRLNGRPIAMMRVESVCTSCAWSPDGRSLYVGGSRGLNRFDLRGQQPVP